MIRHSVIFTLNCAKSSAKEDEFLKAAGKLSAIPGVINFEALRQTSKKNDFDYGLSMEFATQQAYDNYNSHAEHAAFIENYWKKYVIKFLEIDYEAIK